jgi:hypothetical protein
MLILSFFSFFFSFRFLYIELPIVQVVAHFVSDLYLDWLSSWHKCSVIFSYFRLAINIIKKVGFPKY